MIHSQPRHVVESHVLAVLAGKSLQQTAHKAGVDPLDLAAAVETYCAAGREALAQQGHATEWHHAYIHLAEWATSEHTAARHLGPPLRQLHHSGVLAGWWFLRKHPHWLLRWLPGPHTTTETPTAAVTALLDHLVSAGHATRWHPGIYEPETIAFGGGPHTLDIAHTLFHADSDAILTHLHHLTPHNHTDDASTGKLVGRRELSLLLCTTLLRSARQDTQEQGDIWDRVNHMRAPSHPHPVPGHPPGLPRLLRVDTSSTSSLFNAHNPLAFADPWFAHFATAGRQLATAAKSGAVQQGLRHVLANHVIFHWNRLGISTPDQITLAQSARDTLLDPPHIHPTDPAGP